MPSKLRPEPLWTGPFLAALAETGIMCRSAEAAGVSTGTVDARRKAHPKFDEAIKSALARADAARDTAHPSLRRAPWGKGRARGVPKWCMPFLAALAETSNVAASAEQADVEPQTAYRLRRSDPAFAVRWRAALYEGYEHLELEVLAYLRGTESARKLDVANAIRLLGAHRQTVAEMRAAIEDDDEQAVLDLIDALIDRMRAEAAEADGDADDDGVGHD